MNTRVKTMSKPFSKQALEVINKRYLARNDDHEIIEDYLGMFRRVADTLGEDKKEELYQAMVNKKFTPAGRTLANAGGPTSLVSNCIVLHMTDSMDGIFQTLKDAGLLQQQGSGLGFAWHLLRPAGTKAKRNRGIASGPVSFMKVYNQAFGVIKQQNRHGANMGVMCVEHPDILEFIHCKEKEGEIQNFNISVGITDRFMQAVIENNPNPWMAEFPCNREDDYTGEVMRMLPRRIRRDNREVPVEITEVSMTARELFDEIVKCAWNNGEPGIVFLDNANRTNPLPALGKLHTTNPCGEQFLHDGDVCNLGSINLGEFICEDEHGKPAVNWQELDKVTRLAIIALDNVVDNTDHCVDRVNDSLRGNRRIGLGVMGWADMLVRLKIPYGSQESINLAEGIMCYINNVAMEESIQRGERLGTFPNINKSIYKGTTMRNAARTSIAPTGTISMIFDASSGIEPHFALAYKKTVMNGTVFNYINEDLRTVLEQENLLTPELEERIVRSGTIKDITEIPESIRKVFTCAMDLSAEDHIKMQAVFQRHTDNSISKTINFPFEATIEDVQNGYLLAWKMGCKGCTVYRDGSRQVQVLTIDTPKDTNCKDGTCEL
jgi:ribonucleoside-diphosphate reductase alpha chain